MTHEDLELREFLATRLHGVRVRHHKSGDGGWLTDVIVPGGVNQIDFVGKMTLAELARVIPAYESTGDGMLATIEAMRARGFCVTIEYGPGESSVCYATFSRAEPRGYGHAKALPAPLAVALAARAALEGGK